MHAVIVNVTITDPETAAHALREQLVPRVSQLPGFVTGYWTIKDNTGLTMLIFDSEAAANAMSEMAKATVPDAMTLEDVEVREVAAHASQPWARRGGGRLSRSTRERRLAAASYPGSVADGLPTDRPRRPTRCARPGGSQGLRSCHGHEPAGCARGRFC
jgi:hypothetical protein